MGKTVKPKQKNLFSTFYMIWFRPLNFENTQCAYYLYWKSCSKQQKKKLTKTILAKGLSKIAVARSFARPLPLPIAYSTQGQYSYILVKEFSKSVNDFRRLASTYNLTNKCYLFIIFVQKYL